MYCVSSCYLSEHEIMEITMRRIGVVTTVLLLGALGWSNPSRSDDSSPFKLLTREAYQSLPTSSRYHVAKGMMEAFAFESHHNGSDPDILTCLRDSKARIIFLQRLAEDAIVEGGYADGASDLPIPQQPMAGLIGAMLKDLCLKFEEGRQ